MRTERRAALTFIAAAASAVFLVPEGKALAIARLASEQDSFARRYAALFRRQHAARAVGLRYLASHPQEADPNHLRGLLFGGSGDIAAGRLRKHIASLRREDFTSGNTVILDGWVLSRSELRACALLATMRPT